jgi:CBS domain-containing protein
VLSDHEQQVRDRAEQVAGRSPRPAARRAAVFGVRTAADVMDRRPPAADQDTSLWGAWGRLRGAGNRHLVVVDRQSHPLGVVEERELALHWPPGPVEAHRVPLRHLVRGRPRAQARSGDDLATVARTMLAARTDAVPVVDDDGRLLGLVTARHCVELVARRGVA